jgi:GT2 family glycosyltransferase
MIDSSKSKETNAISVVIPTYNRAKVLERVLPGYLQSELVREVVVVDDGSLDNTKTIVSKLMEREQRIHYIQHQENRGRTYARNTGIDSAHSELILITEDDVVPAAGSLEILSSHLAESKGDIIAGRRIWLRLGESEQEAIQRANRSKSPPVNRRFLDHNSHALTATDVQVELLGATMLAKRGVFSKVRFANCYGGNAWREESDFQLLAASSGYRLIFCPHSIFYHYDRAMAWAGSSRIKSDLDYIYWIFRNNLIFLQRHREYLKKNIPESLILGSPILSSVLYSVYRSAWLLQLESRRMRLSKEKHKAS